MIEMNDNQIAEGPVCLIRIYWMLISNVILLFILIAIIEKLLHPLIMSLIYWITVASMIAARFVDIRYLKGKTIDGRSATFPGWLRYAITVLMFSLIAWGMIIANFIKY